jgi:uncharacterized protein
MITKLNPQQIDAVLTANSVGRIGCYDGEKIYVVPVSYVYENGYIICHSLEGMKIDMMRKNPSVCFEVDAMQSMQQWQSVILWGQYEELQDETEKYYAMKIFVDRMMHMKLGETGQPPHISEQRVHPRHPDNIHPVIYRIRITEATGRSEEA